jgi:hypothetical protein
MQKKLASKYQGSARKPKQLTLTKESLKELGPRNHAAVKGGGARETRTCVG